MKRCTWVVIGCGLLFSQQCWAQAGGAPLPQRTPTTTGLQVTISDEAAASFGRALGEALRPAGVVLPTPTSAPSIPPGPPLSEPTQLILGVQVLQILLALWKRWEAKSGTQSVTGKIDALAAQVTNGKGAT